jgi:ADP-heptose:LPS heptosyltransferase
MVVGGGHFTKQIPVDKIQMILNQVNCSIVLLGGPEDREKASQLHFPKQGKVLNLVGKLTINQSAQIIKKSNLVVTPDTGLMHIAAAFHKKIISVWGNTIPAFGMYPYCPEENSQIFEVQGLKCRPCSKIGFSKCPKKHFNCMNQQNYQTIIQTIHFWLKN